MKHLACTIALSLCPLLANSAPSVCAALEFAELQTYSHSELRELQELYTKRGFELGVPYVEFQNCIDQIKRISKIIETRKKNQEQKAEDQPAAKDSEMPKK